MGVWIETKKLEADLLEAKSHPVWVCGLKLYVKKKDGTSQRHTLYGCVDWNIWPNDAGLQIASHTLYGCVDWN